MIEYLVSNSQQPESNEPNKAINLNTGSPAPSS